MKSRRLITSIVTCLLGLLAASRAGILEPSTVLYGKVINPTSGQPYLLTEGTLEWTVAVPDRPAVVLKTDLEPLGNGIYSYRLDVPHEAVSLGLSADPRTVPLSFGEVLFRHSTILVDGGPAEIATPGADVFAASQTTRGFTHRIDLLVRAPLPDTDGDGIPDWWEQQNGLDPQDNDALADSDGDGRTNIDEFRNGTDPNADNTAPTLATSAVLAYQGGRTGLRLVTLDADSAPANIVYTLTQAPATGALRLRGLADDLDMGATFTQEDVDSGRLVYVHSADGVEAASFALSVRDEDPEHAPSAGSVKLQLYRPTPAAESAWPTAWLDAFDGSREDILDGVVGLPSADARRVANYFLSRWLDHVVWDAADAGSALSLRAPSAGYMPEAYQAEFVDAGAPDAFHVMVGGPGDDAISGSMEDDIIDGGPGNDMLRGNGGSDIFVFRSTADGSDTIADFDLESDRIDLSGILGKAPAGDLDRYVRFATAPAGTELGIDVDGDGSGFIDMVIMLAGVALGDGDVYQLADNGQLAAGELELSPRVSLAVSAQPAREDGPVAGEITVTRAGTVATALTINILVSGSASNGADFAYVGQRLAIPAGQRTATIRITPYADTLVEAPETVDVTLLPGDGYEVGSADSATLTILDMKERISLEVVEPVAVRDTQAPALILVKRAGLKSRATTVLLRIGGTATNAVDYRRISSTVSFAAEQASALIQVMPEAGADLADGAETVTIAVRPDPAANYELGEPADAGITIVEDEAALAAWLVANPEGPGGDPDHDRLTNADEEQIGSDPLRPTLVLKAGWNLISTPRLPGPEDTIRTQLGDAYVGAAWYWEDGRYAMLAEDAALEPGLGYFIFCLDPAVVDLPDTPEGDGQRTVTAGWNLIGPVRGGQRSGSDLAGVLLYGFADGVNEAVAADAMAPMQGYWLHSLQPKTIVLP